MKSTMKPLVKFRLNLMCSFVMHELFRKGDQWGTISIFVGYDTGNQNCDSDAVLSI